MNEHEIEHLVSFDRKHLWHPYTSILNPPTTIPVVSASGVRLKLADGKELIDGMSSWWSAIHGYNHPVLNTAAQRQLALVSHVMFGGITHPAAVKLGELLISLTPPTLQTVFFSDSGSVAVEVALKMALQYQMAQGKPEKWRILSFGNGYHGDTFGAMAVTDPVNGMHQLFQPLLPKHLFAPTPPGGFNIPPDPMFLTQLEALFADHHHELAAAIIEPVLQGAGGMRLYHPDYLTALRRLCDRYDVLLILDEIATGFGRTGKLFALQHADIEPDLLCLGKAMTGGYLSLAATLCSAHVAEGICQGDPGVFMHGPTFMANPLACAIANASIRLLLSQPWHSMVNRIEKTLHDGLSPLAGLEQVKEVRVLGAVGVVEMSQPVDARALQPLFLAEGVWVRPFGNIIYLMPPYIISEADLKTLCQALVTVVRNLPTANQQAHRSPV